MKNVVYIIFILALFTACNPEEVLKQDLTEGWEFSNQHDSINGQTTVPGVIHTDLLASGIIDDPFYGENEEKLQWIGENEWVYTVKIIPEPGILEKQHIDLVFEGLDTYAEVFLNDSLILRTDNMFRTWQVDVKGILHNGDNKLKVSFSPPGKINEEKAARLPYKLPDNRAFTRKSPYQFGWDWGPVFLTCGIWKPVYLRGWDGFRIINVHMDHGSIDQDPLPVDVMLRIESDVDAGARVRIFDVNTGSRLLNERISLQKGTHHYSNFYVGIK